MLCSTNATNRSKSTVINCNCEVSQHFMRAHTNWYKYKLNGTRNWIDSINIWNSTRKTTHILFTFAHIEWFHIRLNTMAMIKVRWRDVNNGGQQGEIGKARERERSRERDRQKTFSCDWLQSTIFVCIYHPLNSDGKCFSWCFISQEYLEKNKRALLISI